MAQTPRLLLNTVTMASNYTLTFSDSEVSFDATAAVRTATMPDATLMLGKILTVKKFDSSANAVNILFTNGQTAESRTSIALHSQNEYFMFQSNGSNWIIISTNESIILTCLGTGAPTGTLNGSFNRTTYTNKVVDTHGIYSGGIATIPVTTNYQISAGVKWSSTSTGVDTDQIIGIFVNGVEKTRGGQRAYASSNAILSPQVTTLLALNAGDLVDVRVSTGSGGTLAYNGTGATDNYFILSKK